MVDLFLFNALHLKTKTPLCVGLVPLTCFFLSPDMNINCVKIIFALKELICKIVITQRISSHLVPQGVW